MIINDNKARAQKRLGQYAIFEKRGKVGVLLIHGVTGAPTEMKHLVRKLTGHGFSVACPQLAGHCSSLKELKATRWKDWYASVVAGLDFLSEECDQIFVAGLSMGALLALKLAADWPERVQGVATLSATFFYDGWNVPQLKRRLLLPLVIYSPLRYFLSYREPSPYGIKDERMRNLVALLYSSNSNNMPEKYGYAEFPAVTIRETMRLIKAVKQDLPRVIVPTLILHSTEDDMASLKNARFLKSRIGSNRIEACFLEDTYHVLTLDRRKDDVANRISEFISSCVENDASMDTAPAAEILRTGSE
ncbi:MAG: alpha/beta hydrolase [Sulfuricaulis sp.]